MDFQTRQKYDTLEGNCTIHATSAQFHQIYGRKIEEKENAKHPQL